MIAKNWRILVATVPTFLSTSGIAWAGSATYSVPGTADPFLSAAPNGATCCMGDSAPPESPVHAGSVTGGETLTFTNVTGGVSFSGGTPMDPPDGDAGFPISTPTYEGGLSYINFIAGYLNMPVDALVGVFLPAGGPLAADKPSSLLDFSSSGVGTNFTSLSPGLQQIFFIGDGLTGTGSGSVQTFVVPAGATEFYLAVADGEGWYNNTGAIEVTVNGGSTVPEASTWALMLVGFAGLGFAGYRKARRSRPAVFAA
jgi:hypothetical protein